MTLRLPHRSAHRRLAAIALAALLALPFAVRPAAAQEATPVGITALAPSAPAAPAGAPRLYAQDDVLVLDDGDAAADDFFGFVDGSSFYWANRFQLGSVGFRLEAFTFHMRTEGAARNAVYLAVLDGSGETLAAGTVDYDLAAEGGWFEAALDAPIDFAPGAAFFLKVGNASGDVTFPAGIDGGVLGAGAQAVAYVAAGPDEELQALDGSFQRDAFLVRAVGMILRLNAPPSVSLAAPSGTAAAGTPLTVTAGITDDGTLDRVTLLYETGGGATQSAAMTPGGGGYQAAIPASAVTAGGVRYAVEAEDDGGLASRSAWRSQRVRVAGDGLSRGLSWSGDRYRLVSVPLALDAAGAADVLGDDLGPYDVDRWRFYGLGASQEYAEYPGSGALQPGRAFWLALRESGQSFDTGAGTSLPLDGPFVVDLHAGWNFVGTPFAFDVPPSQIRLASGEALDVRAFSDGWRTHGGAFRPFEGYAVFVPAADRLEVWPTADGALKTAPRAADAQLDWSLTLVAETAHGRDSDNVAAVGDGATDAWDAADRAEPPAVGPYVAAYFDAPAAGHRLSRDTRATHGTWTLHVETAASERVRLHIPDLDALPAGLGAWLVDAETGRRHDLRAEPGITFTSRAGRSPRTFLLLVAPADEKALPSAPAAFVIYPNPVREGAIVRLHLAAPGPVRLVAYDLLGREALVVHDGPLAAGEHTLTVDAARLPAGTYLLRLAADGERRTRSFVRIR